MHSTGSLQESADNIRKIFQSALDKLHVGMMSGPNGEDVTLTPGEATMLYRLATEHAGIRHEGH